MTRRINGDALENRDGTAVTGDVFVFDDAHVDGGKWEAPGAGSASAAWPVGSIFLSAVSTNPATLLGFGTWSAIGAGRVLIGIDAGDVDFDTLGETGGAKTSAHAHGAGTLATSGGSWHSHGLGTLATVAESSHTHTAGTLAPSAHSATTVGNHTVTQPGNHTSHSHGTGTLVVTDPDTGASNHTARHEHAMTQVYAHTHDIASGQGSHDHTVPTGTADDAGGYAADRATYDSTNSVTTNARTLPAMVTDSKGSATARTDGPLEAGSFTPWDTDHSVSGSTGNESATLTHSGTAVDAHSVTGPGDHTLPGTSSAGSSHSHGVSGTLADEGAHTHGVSGSTGSDSTSVVQPYLVVAMWQRTA